MHLPYHAARRRPFLAAPGTAIFSLWEAGLSGPFEPSVQLYRPFPERIGATLAPAEPVASGGDVG
jgi:hypothetical protein